MITCVSPNGSTTLFGQQLSDTLAVATTEGVVTARTKGGEWGVVGRALTDHHIASLAYDEAANTLCACSYDGGVFLSEDGGSTWSALTGIPGRYELFTIALCRRRGELVMFLGTEPVALFESTDLGQSWSELPAIASTPNQEMWTFPAPPHTAHLKSIAFDPVNEDTLYACVEQGGLYRSSDAGRSFVEIESVVVDDEAAGKDLHRLVVDPNDPDRLFCTSGDGVIVSENRGASWRRLLGRGFSIGYPDALVIDPRDSRILYLAGATAGPGRWRHSHTADAHVAVSRDAADTWTLIDTGLPDPLRGNIEAMSFSCSPKTSRLVLATTDGEVYESTDEGGHWHLALKGLAPISKGGHFHALTNH